MGLEVATYINGLVSTNPVGATDPKSQGDDHIRLLKSTIKASFPAVAGAVSADHTELSLMDGITGFTGTGATLVKSASPTFTGTPVVPDAWLTFAKIQNADAVSVLGRSANSSGVMDEIAAGANDRILARTSNALSFVQLTAGMFPSTIVPDAALSANVPLLNAANTFTANPTVSRATPKLILNETNGAQFAALQFQDGGSHRGYVGMQTAADQFITGTAADTVAITSTAGIVLSGDGTTAHFALSTGGVVTTPNASASEVGYKGSPTNLQNNLGGAYTLATSDQGKTIVLQGTTSSITVTSGKPAGMNFTVVNNTGGNITLTQSSTSLYLAGVSAGSPGTRTLADRGVMYCVACFGADAYICSGIGVS